MKTLSKAIAIASLVSASALTAQVANAEVSFNAAVVSDYVWRGMSQTDNGFAVQGGADYSHESGAYAGIWASNVDYGDDDSIEYDYYFGFATEVNGLDVDAGYISYNLDDSGEGSVEVYASVAKDALSAMLSVDIENDNNMYLEGGYSMDLPEDLGLDLHAGYMIPDDSAVDAFFDLSATVGKSLEMFDVAATVTYNDFEFAEDDVLFFLSASKEF
jgi:uncharacterized protein (TIGR02001 family)